MIRIVSSNPDTLIIQIETDLKMENAPIFLDEFQERMTDAHREVVIDFRAIRFVDSSGVGVLLRIANQIKDRSGKFLIFGLNRSLTSVFKLAGLLKIFEILDEEKAKAAYPELFQP